MLDIDWLKDLLAKADQLVNKAATTVLDPILGQGSKIDNAYISMQNPTRDPVDDFRAIGNAAVKTGEAIVSAVPDYAAITVSGDVVVGGGVGGDVNIGYVKGDGVFVNAEGRAGSGFDVSVAVSATWGNYKGTGTATATSLAGPGVYENAGASFVGVGAWQDIGTSTTTGKAVVAPNWSGGNAGVTLGSKSFFGGSFGASYTTKPLYIYNLNF